ncbi:MAG: hypothetical protein HFH42_06950 [Lachnospiraceae bacterium]|jgi:uncharacterized protein YjdB|nr:hypothetical protein [Lachnospiraceae bacterium]
MNSKKLFTFALSCLLLLETPFTSMAAPNSPTEAPFAVVTAAKAKKNSGSKPQTMALKATSVTIYTENTYRLKVASAPSGTISWKSSKPKVASVNTDGVITGLTPGTAKITASVGGAKTSCTVTVLKNTHKLNKETQVLMKGNSATLYLSNVSEDDSVSFELADPASEVVDISSSGNKCKVTAENPGTVTLTATYTSFANDQKVTSTQTCTIEVIETGIKQQQIAMAVKTKKSLTLKNVNKPEAQVVKTTWTSSNPKIASITPNSGIVKGKRAGDVEITATVDYSDGTSSVFPTAIRVSNPKIKSSGTVLSLGKTTKVKLSGTTSFSSIKWKVKNSSLASIEQDGTVTAGDTPGTTTISVTVDGKTINHPLTITQPQLTADTETIATGKKIKVPLDGVSSNSKITYKSRNKSIATVNKSGVITGRSSGMTDIYVTADGVALTFHVRVISKKALSACKNGYKIMYSSSYSQARRMSHGYYDCSSLVFRAYGCDSKLLGGTPSWAPTAATMAAYMERTGKVISYKGIDSSELLPGDLIFYRMKRGSNGRYRNIYHVSMYYGDGYRLEKPLRRYAKESHITMIARPTK